MSAFENDPTPVYDTPPGLCRPVTGPGTSRAGASDAAPGPPEAEALPETEEEPTRPAADPLGSSDEALVPTPWEANDLVETGDHTEEGWSRLFKRRTVAFGLAGVAGVVFATALFIAGTVYERYAGRGQPAPALPALRGQPTRRMEQALDACRPERSVDVAIQVERGRVKQAHVDASPTPGNACIGQRLEGLALGRVLEGFSRWRVTVEGRRVRLLLLDPPRP